MEKESVKKFDLEAAFKALDEIEIPQTKGIKANRVDLKERFSHKPATETLVEDYYDVSSNEDLEEAKEEREGEVAQAKLARIEKIVDLDAETADDLLPSYVGKVIIQCPQCMTLFYKNPEDIEHSDENPDVVNINEVCQHCGNTSGYTLIGKVDSVSDEEADKYEAAENGEATEEGSELDLDFEEPTEEVDAERTGEGAEEMSDEELDELNLELEDLPEEEPEEEKKEESLNLSKETSENETEHKSEDLTLNEEKILTQNPDNKDEVIEVEVVNGEAQMPNGEKKKVVECNEELTEEVDKDLDKKLKAHNDYIAYLQQMIKQEEEALKKTNNEEVKAAIQRRLDAFNADLEAALPDAVKSVPEVAVDELADSEPVVEEEPKEEPAEEEAPVEEALTEDSTEEEKPVEGNEIDYVEYKHSYCHALEPKLKAINYLVNVKKVEPKILKGYILKLLKDADVKWTEKEKEFKKNIEEKEDVYDILNYVKNSIEKAKTIKVKVDENGELIESLNEGFEGCLYEVLTESLNKSETAVSENKTENESENLTLNEAADSEIDAIIASWKEPSDSEVVSIEAPVEEGYTGNPAERTTHLEYTDENPADGKAVLPDNIEKQLTEGEECKESECEKPLEECGEKSLAEGRYDKLPPESDSEEPIKPGKLEMTKCFALKAADGKVSDRVYKTKEEAEEAAKKYHNATVVETEYPAEWLEECSKKPLKEEDEISAEEEAPTEEEPVEEPIIDEPVIPENSEEVTFTPEEAKNIAADVAVMVAEPVANEEDKEKQDEEIKEIAEEKVEAAIEEKVEEANEGEVEEPVEGEEAPVEVEEPVEEALEESNEAGLDTVLDSKEFDTPVSESEVKAALKDESLEKCGTACKEEEPLKECGKLEIEDLNEEAFNSHIKDFLQEVYSNVKDFAATNCELKENKLIIEGKISFNSGKEKLTMFEFLPEYGDGKLFLEGINKDFSDDKAFMIECTINENKELITEQLCYHFKINEALVEGIK